MLLVCGSSCVAPCLMYLRLSNCLLQACLFHANSGDSKLQAGILAGESLKCHYVTLDPSSFADFCYAIVCRLECPRKAFFIRWAELVVREEIALHHFPLEHFTLLSTSEESAHMNLLWRAHRAHQQAKKGQQQKKAKQASNIVKA